MLFQGTVGQVNVGDGTNTPARIGKQGDVIESPLNPRYYEQNYRGNMFFAANTANQALSVANATYTGLAVANPTGSGKNLVMIDALFAIDVAQTGLSAIVLGTAPTVALTTGNSSGPSGSSALVGSANASVAKVGASATLGAAPTIIRALSGGLWITSNTSTGLFPIKDEIGGAIILAPGQLICIEAITTAVTGLASFTWVEIPV